MQVVREVKKNLEKLEIKKEKFRDWFVKRAEGPHAKFWLILISFTEASFFLIPPDILLIAVILGGVNRWMYYASLTLISSVLGGIFGFLIGMFLFETIGETIISFYNLEDEMLYLGTLFEQNAFISIFAAAFTPLPYKVFTLSAGFFSISILKFILASLLGRGLRFFIIGYLTNRYRNALNDLILKYFNIISLILVIGVLLFIIFLKIL